MAGITPYPTSAGGTNRSAHGYTPPPVRKKKFFAAEGGPGFIPYYPNEKYVNKNLAPEQFPEESVRAIAAAERAATKSGLLPQKLAQAMLANSLVEGRPLDFGMNSYSGPRDPVLESNIQRMGLKVGAYASSPPPESEDWGDEQYAAWEKKSLPNPGDINYLPPVQDPDDPEARSVGGYNTFEVESISSAAKLAAAILARKAQLYGEQKALERWNGQGPGARRHVQKVLQMQQMLQHPKNQAMREAYARYLAENQ